MQHIQANSDKITATNSGNAPALNVVTDYENDANYRSEIIYHEVIVPTTGGGPSGTTPNVPNVPNKSKLPTGSCPQQFT